MWLHRIILAGLLIFWGVMNYLLWRAEFGEGRALGGRVPVEAVWERILTSPDDSTLEVRLNESRIGYCRWQARVAEELDRVPVGDGLDGLVDDPSGYVVKADGNLLWDRERGSIGFRADGEFGDKHDLRRLAVELYSRPHIFNLEVNTVAGQVRISAGDRQTAFWERELPLSALSSPSQLLGALNLPGSPSLPWAAQPLSGTEGKKLVWEARQDWIEIGRSRVRVYRIRGGMGGRPMVDVVVSRVGELLEVELPGGIRMINEALIHL